MGKDVFRLSLKEEIDYRLQKSTTLSFILRKINPWRSWIRASWYNYENNQQDALYRLIYYSKSAVHTSAMFSPIIRSTWLYLQYLVVFTQVSANYQPAATWVNTNRYCKYTQVLLMMGENIAEICRADWE